MIIGEISIQLSQFFILVYRQRAFAREKIIGSEERPRDAAGLPGQNSESEPESRCRSALDGSIFHVIREQLHLFQKKNCACADNVALFANVGMHVLIYWPEDKVRGWDAGT